MRGRNGKQTYPKLNDINWLKQKYLVEKFSTTKIGKIIGCHRTTVIKNLQRHKIERRSNPEAQQLVTKDSKYHLLNNKNWLYQKYIVEKLSTIKVCELTGAKTCNSVRQSLIKHGISVRSQREGQIALRKNEGFVLNESVITGGLLGDATMGIHNKESNISCPTFRRKNKFYDHVEYVGSKIYSKEFAHKIRKDFCTNGDKTYKAYVLETLSYESLKPVYEKWYPKKNNYIKLVPRDIPIDKIVLLHWFLDDGTTSWRIRKYGNGWFQNHIPVRLVFCSESFTKEDNQFLCDSFNKKFNLGMRLKKCNSGTGWRIVIPQSKVKDFFNVIGPPPVKSLAYRWKIPGEHQDEY